MSRKEIFLHLVRAVGALRLARIVTRVRPRRLIVLAYHRVLDMGNADTFPFDPELVSATPREFEWQMSFVKRHFDAITFQDVLESLKGRVHLPRRPVIVSFDDGFEDNYLNAYPVLRAVGVPATFFISTGYIGKTATFWFDALAHLMLRVPRGVIVLDEIGKGLPERDDLIARRVATAQLLAALKKLPELRRQTFLAQVQSAWGHLADPAHAALSRPMTWEQVDEMARGGMEFGSHTVTHPILSTMDDTSLSYELSASKHEIEQRLRRPIDVIGYPVGTADAYSDKVVAAVRAAGYRLGCSYVPGINSLRHLDAFRIRRQHVERTTDRLQFEGLLSLPEVID